MKTGIIKSYVEEKGYGFIQTEDNSVYFKVEDLSYDCLDKIKIGQAVTFDEVPTPKGNKAVDVSIADKKELKYEFPEETIILRKHEKLKDGYVLLDNSNFEVFVNLRNPNNLEAFFTKYLSILGANAAIDVVLSKTTGEEPGTGQGIHCYTIHKFSGKIARVGKISSEGQSISELPDLNSQIETIIEENSVKFKREQKNQFIFRLGLSATLFLFLLLFAGAVYGAIIMYVIAFIAPIFSYFQLKSFQKKRCSILNPRKFVRKFS